jgi:hypothetical protein
MAYTTIELRTIYDRTTGRCHICRKKLSFTNYGVHGARASWHVEHSIPRAVGGTDRMNNLYAACIDCNIEKSTASTRSARAKYGRTRAPKSRTHRAEVRTENTATGAAVGGLIGWLIAPELMLVGLLAGAVVGNSADID